MEINAQLKTPLTLVNGEKLPNVTRFVLGGMGGSRLPAEFSTRCFPPFRFHLEKLRIAAGAAERRALYRKFIFGQYERNAFIFDEARAEYEMRGHRGRRGIASPCARGWSAAYSDSMGRGDSCAPHASHDVSRTFSLVMKKDDIVREVFEASPRAGVYERGVSLWLHSRGVHNGILCIGEERNSGRICKNRGK